MDSDNNPPTSGSDNAAGGTPDNLPKLGEGAGKSTATPADKPRQPTSAAAPAGSLDSLKPALGKAGSDKNKPATAGSKKSSAGKAGSSESRADKPGVKKPPSATPPGEPPAAKQPKAHTGRRWLAVLAVVLLLLVGGYFLVWPHYGDRLQALYPHWLAGDDGSSQQHQAQDQQPSGQPDQQPNDETLQELPATTDPTSTEPSIDPRSTSGEGLSTPAEADTVDTALAATLRDQMAELQLQLNSQAEVLRRLSTTRREDWLLAEAEYLLRLASQRLLTERQSANAVALMVSADAILRDINDPSLYPVRKALAEDMTLLRLAVPIDREGIYLRIGALVAAVATLDSPLSSLGERPPAAPRPIPDSWYGRLLDNARQALTNMVGLIRIERRHTPLQPMLTAAEEQILRDNLRLVLEQARLALLREEPAIYRASLEQATGWVSDHFVDNSRRTVYLDELAQLAGQTVQQELVSLAPSLRALQDYIRLWHNRVEVDGDDERQPAAGAQR